MKTTMFKKVIFGGAIAAFLVGCGDEESQFIRDFTYDVAEDEVGIGLEFNHDVELNTEMTVPILEYGSIGLKAPRADSGFIIEARVNMDAIVDPWILDIERTRLLPNGRPMSNYVTTDVGRFRTQPHEMVAINLYLGLDPSELYLGTAIEIGFLDENFPEGLVLSQRIRNAQGQQLGVITMYGPNLEDGVLVAPGGIFFMTNISELIRNGEERGALSIMASSVDHALIPDHDMYINAEHRKKYSHWKKQRQLFRMFNYYGKKAGMVD